MLDVATLRQAALHGNPGRADPDWLRAAHEQALQAFSRQGLPTTTDEDWRYTDLRPLAPRVLELIAEAPTASTPPSVGINANVVLVDGRYRPELASGALPDGVTLHALSQSPANATQLPAWGMDSEADAGGVPALKAALLRDGVRLAISAQAQASVPIHVALLAAGNSLTHNRLHIDLAPGASATIIEHHLGPGNGLHCATTAIHCAPGARLQYVKIQELADGAWHLGAQRISLDSSASATLLHLDLGARLARNELSIDLAGADAVAEAHGLFFADGNRHLDNHTRLDHRAPATRSRETYRGIMDGTGRGVFNGKIIVHPGANRADAALRNQNLLLSTGAEVDTKPELEIYADDVKCSHGATTGQLDRNAVFYLRSRGIPQEQARRILIASFAREIVMHLPGDALRNRIVSVLGERLPGLIEAGQRP